MTGHRTRDIFDRAFGAVTSGGRRRYIYCLRDATATRTAMQLLADSHDVVQRDDIADRLHGIQEHPTRFSTITARVRAVSTVVGHPPLHFGRNQFRLASCCLPSSAIECSKSSHVAPTRLKPVPLLAQE
jgi:hypothetical protein